jgi:hypothetical protein
MKMNEINNSYKNKLNNLKDFINTETLNDELNINDKIDVMSYKQNEEKFKKYFNNLDIDNDIKALELNLLTVEDYKKKLFNPSIFLFVNKFQISKLTKELEKILKKTCDFDEKIEKYNINELNKHESSLFFLEIEKCSQNSNTDKIKYIFDHFYLNPNFTYISKRSNRNIVGCFDKYLKNFTEEENRNLLIDYLKEEYNYLNLENFDLTNMKKTLSGMNINLLKI